jgi:molybdate transport system ATP-binding protein
MADELTCRCRKRFASGFTLDAALEIPLDRSPVTVLFGPSGAGKTTLLRLLAGLEQPDAGEIHFRGRRWDGLPPQARRAGFLFQDYALFPHLSVRRNVSYAADRQAAERALEAFGLAELEDRMPGALSGGERQRVALARALAAGPALLLLDEPLSALDVPARRSVRRELRRMLLAGGVPAVVVTHDRAEAAALGDLMAVMVAGRIRQTGPVRDVLRRPAAADVAAALGVENILPARPVGNGWVDVCGVALRCADSGTPAGPLFACFRAEDVALSVEAPIGAAGGFACCVESVSADGPLARVELDCGFPLVALAPARTVERLLSGGHVWAAPAPESVHVLP